MKKGLVHIYYGDGKGKTSAAMGAALRAMGHKMYVLIVQFMKSGDSGEISQLCKLDHATVLYKKQKGKKKFVSQMTPEERQEYAKGQNNLLSQVMEICQKEEYDMVVMDEVLTAYQMGIIDHENLKELLRSRPSTLEVVMTGHHCPEEIAWFADYVTEMKKHRHPYDRGVKARIGVEK